MAKSSAVDPFTAHQRSAWKRGYRHIAGIDEAGRGPLAGPVVAAACIIPTETVIEGVCDSKMLSRKKRAEVFTALRTSVIYGIGLVDHSDIDRINIYQATILAMRKAVDVLPEPPDYLLIDGNALLHHNIPEEAIIKGDKLSQVIAAASIFAKVTRDRMMMEYHKMWPEYGFNRHMGYPTKAHMAAIAHHGPSPIHRRTFRPDLYVS